MAGDVRAITRTTIRRSVRSQEAILTMAPACFTPAKVAISTSKWSMVLNWSLRMARATPVSDSSARKQRTMNARGSRVPTTCSEMQSLGISLPESSPLITAS